MKYIIFKETHTQEGHAHSISYIALEEGRQKFYIQSLDRYNAETMLDEAYSAEALFTITLHEDTKDAEKMLEEILTLAGLQMDKFIRVNIEPSDYI